MIHTRGCWSFFTTVVDLKKFSKKHGILATEQHLKDCPACARRFEVRQDCFFKTVANKNLPTVPAIR